MMLPPGLDWLMRAVSSLMFAQLYLFVFGLVAVCYRMVLGA